MGWGRMVGRGGGRGGLKDGRGGASVAGGEHGQATGAARQCGVGGPGPRTGGSRWLVSHGASGAGKGPKLELGLVRKRIECPGRRGGAVVLAGRGRGNLAGELLRGGSALLRAERRDPGQAREARVEQLHLVRRGRAARGRRSGAGLRFAGRRLGGVAGTGGRGRGPAVWGEEEDISQAVTELSVVGEAELAGGACRGSGCLRSVHEFNLQSKCDQVNGRTPGIWR